MSAKDRKGSRDKRKNNGNALAGTLFTAAMICCCVLIYLLSRGGRNTAKDTSMEIPPQPTAQMERVYPSVEVFCSLRGQRATALMLNTPRMTAMRRTRAIR